MPLTRILGHTLWEAGARGTARPFLPESISLEAVHEIAAPRRVGPQVPDDGADHERMEAEARKQTPRRHVRIC